ncbi:MAG: hypothetical protein JWM80_1088 [Cyanobacteria bacterium RYN_339]|nr:hypothetical protein [Cyanobacteria bacterium RYN_339]
MADQPSKSRKVELAEQKAAAEHELAKLEKANKQVVSRILSSMRHAKAMLELAEEQLLAATKERDPAKRENQIYLNGLRKEAALCNLEMLQLFADSDMLNSIRPDVFVTIDLMCLRTQYIATEYNIRIYQRYQRIINEALTDKPAGDQPPAKPTGNTGNLGAGLPGRTGTGPLPPRPGIPAPGARPGAPGLAAPRPMPPQRAPLPRTGPLNANAAGASDAGPRPGLTPPGGRPTPGLAQQRHTTGRLAGAGAAAAPSAEQQNATLVAELRAGIEEDPTNRQKLQVLLGRVQELEELLTPIRGDTPGSLGLDLATAAGPLKQMAGKVYYINRALAALGELGKKLPFDNGPPDPQVTSLLRKLAETSDVPEPEPVSNSAQQQESLVKRLRSLFGT